MLSATDCDFDFVQIYSRQGSSSLALMIGWTHTSYIIWVCGRLSSHLHSQKTEAHLLAGCNRKIQDNEVV